MHKMLEIISTLFIVGSFTSCQLDRSNPVDEKGNNYVPPTITINNDASTVKNNDTIHFDTATIVLIGNKSQSRFRVKVDNGEWTTDWQPAGPFSIGGMPDGRHTLLITTMYVGGDSVVADSISFHVLVEGYKPSLTNAADTIIASDTGRVIEIAASASGAAPLQYAWFKKGITTPQRDGDTLKFDPFSITDTSAYTCIATNKYGIDTSRVFILKFRPATGGIKGSIVDASNNHKLAGVHVTLLPVNRSVSTDTSGLFEFKGLSARGYSLAIINAGYNDSTITGIEVNDSETIVLPSIVLSKAILSKVIYNGNGSDSGSVPVDNNSYKPGVVITVGGNSGKLIKIGHSFDGWSRSEDGSGTVYAPADTFSMGKSTDTLYAVWKINQYTLSFDGNKNTFGDAPEEMKRDYNSTITIPDKGNLERTGYTFSGWNANREGTGTAYAAGATFKMPDSNVVLFAKWEKLPTFKVTYDGNHNTGGTVPTDTNIYHAGQKVTVFGNPGILEKKDFSFAGWNENDSGTGENYTSGSTFSMPSSPITLYARWTTKPTYIIVYDGNTNTGGNAPDTVNFDSGATVTIADSGSLFKTGYSFTGWNSLQNGTGTAFKPGDKRVMDTVSITLYAQWTESRYTVTYHGNGNTGGTVPPPSNHLYGTKATVANAGDLEKTGHTFYRWNTDSTGNGFDYNASDQITINSKNIDLYARWTKNKYKVVYIGNGNDGGTVPQSADYEFNATVNVADKGSMSRTGHSFNGWNRAKNGGGSNISPGSDFTMGASNDTLFAQWKPNRYSVKFNTFGGNAIDSVMVNYGDTVPVPTKPGKTSYVFSEWYRDYECKVKWNFSTDTIIGNDTLYAKWVIMDVDGNIYTEVKIGNQVWMVENLKVIKYRDKISIPKMSETNEWLPGYCWYNNDSATYKNPYGVLYNWYVVDPANPRKVAPEGWHIPSDDEWTELENYLIANGYNYDGTTTDNKIAKSLAATTLWNTEQNEGAIGDDLSINNKSGFSAYPAGSGRSDGSFGGIGNQCYWLTTTESFNEEAWCRYLDYYYSYITRYSSSKSSGASVRCIRDW